MDMWDPYVNSMRRHLPGAGHKIVYDKFHVAQHLSETVDLVRREHKQLKAAGAFRNKQNFVTAIYFHCGKLNLSPQTH